MINNLRFLLQSSGSLNGIKRRIVQRQIDEVFVVVEPFCIKRQTSKRGHSFKFIGAMRTYTSDSTSGDQNTVSLYQTTTD